MLLRKQSTASLQKANFSLCINTLLEGGVVALPTETVYGLASLALDPDAVAKIYRLKGRPSTNPLIVHVLNLEQAMEISYPDTICKLLCRKFWPGPLTLIIPKKKVVPNNVTAGLGTVAIRSPSHPLFRKVLKSTGKPLAAPSANPYSTVSPTSAEEVVNSFGSACPPVLDGGKCKIGLESTVLDLTCETPTILRPGPISRTAVEKVIGRKLANPTEIFKSGIPRKSPGLSDKHYAPETPVRLYPSIKSLLELAPSSSENLIIIPSKEFLPSLDSYSATVMTLSENGDSLEIGRNLYATLKKADLLKKKIVHLSLLEETDGMTEAINDRLRRASCS